MNKTELVDRTVADAAFALKEGEVSAPIAGRFGTALVRVVKVEPERIRPFEELAPEIKRNLTRDRARPELQNLHDKVEDERASGLSLEGPAGTTPLSSLTPRDASGLRGADGDAVRVRNPSVLVYDIAGKGFEKFRGVVGIENAREQIGSTLNAQIRDSAIEAAISR